MSFITQNKSDHYELSASRSPRMPTPRAESMETEPCAPLLVTSNKVMKYKELFQTKIEVLSSKMKELDIQYNAIAKSCVA